MVTRREFFKIGAMMAAGLALPVGWMAAEKPKAVKAFSQSNVLRKFIDPLRGIGGATGIPVASKDTSNPGWWQPGVDHYTIDIGQYEDLLHSQLPNPTRLWGFGQNDIFRHLGGIIVARRGTPVQITFRNNLPPTHIIPVDQTIMGVAGNQNNRTNIHLHGGFVPWTSDGGPHAWWDPDGHKGVSFLNNQVLRPGAPAAENEAEYYYPNQQSARLMWYHDHSFGTTRINAYAGIASAYVITDDYEDALAAVNHIPGPLDPRTLYLVFQDKIFVSDDIANTDPNWATIMPASRPGDLWYAHEYDTARWDLAPGGATPDPSVIPEFFGDTMLVNGAAYPTLEVEPRQYRLRMLNACNARFLNPRLVLARGTSFPNNAEPSNAIGPGFIQIGTEGGFLPYPAMLNGAGQPTLLMAPAERVDLLVDFRGVPAGTIFLLYNDGPAPYPMGADINDYYPGNNSITIPGHGPNTRTIMQIKIKARAGAADPAITLPAVFTPTDPFLVTQQPGIPTPIPANVPVRYLTLNEDFDEHGRLIQYLGTSVPVNPGDPAPLFGREYLAEPTEVITAGSTEVWEIINLTGDTHPIHFHLSNAMVLARLPFDASDYLGGQPVTGAPVAPALNELGFKETVRMNPDEVTRVLLRFNLPVVPFTVPVSPRTGGHEYVWHCHILEHEEHDMMRPLVVMQNFQKTYIPVVKT